MHDTQRIAKIRALRRQIKPENRFPKRPMQPFFWKPMALLTRISAQKRVQAWLKTPTSITALLKHLCPNLTVLVISEKEEVPLIDEAQKLGLAVNENAWVRCVLLKCADATWIYARTVAPHLAEDNPWQAIKHLGNKPLGEMLFNDPRICRSEFEFAMSAVHHWPHLLAYLAEQNNFQQSKLYTGRRPQNSYARRSLFFKKNTPLLLTEVFLTPLLVLNKPA